MFDVICVCECFPALMCGFKLCALSRALQLACMLFATSSAAASGSTRACVECPEHFSSLQEWCLTTPLICTEADVLGRRVDGDDIGGC